MLVSLWKLSTVLTYCHSYKYLGEKLSDDEVDALLQGVEDSQGQVNYEGWLQTLCLTVL